MPNFVENKAKDAVQRGDQNPIGLFGRVETVTSDRTTRHAEVILADANGGDIDITLPEPLNSMTVTVKKIDGTGNAVNINTPNGETIDGQGSLSLTSQYTSREIISDGEEFYIR